jgi:hypothetical protein
MSAMSGLDLQRQLISADCPIRIIFSLPMQTATTKPGR